MLLCDLIIIELFLIYLKNPPLFGDSGAFYILNNFLYRVDSISYRGLKYILCLDDILLSSHAYLGKLLIFSWPKRYVTFIKYISKEMKFTFFYNLNEIESFYDVNNSLLSSNAK